jgi:hypothetical protein
MGCTFGRFNCRAARVAFFISVRIRVLCAGLGGIVRRAAARSKTEHKNKRQKYKNFKKVVTFITLFIAINSTKRAFSLHFTILYITARLAIVALLPKFINFVPIHTKQ